MGLEFIKMTAARHTKAWRAEFRKGENDLFAKIRHPINRSFIASLTKGSSINENGPIHVRSLNNQVIVFKELTPIAKIDKPSLALIESLDSSHGIIEGHIEDVDNLFHVATIRIGEKGK